MTTVLCPGCELQVDTNDLVSSTGYPDACEGCVDARNADPECTCYEYHGGHEPGCPRRGLK